MKKETKPLVVRILLIMFATASLLYQIFIWPFRSKPQPPIESRVNTAIHALAQSSLQATTLLSELQQEINAQTSAAEQLQTKLGELQKQRTLLELTPDQRQAIESLIKRQPPDEIFT